MFICNECLKDFRNPESFMKSLGACEMCNKRAVCNDIPSSALKEKKEVPDGSH